MRGVVIYEKAPKEASINILFYDAACRCIGQLSLKLGYNNYTLLDGRFLYGC